MNDPTTSDAWQAFRGVYWSLAIALAVVLLLLALMGFGPGGRNCKVAGTAAVDGSRAVAVSEAPARAGPSCQRLAPSVRAQA